MHNESALIRVLVADDHRVLRAGVKAYLSLSSSGLRCVVDEAETVEEALVMSGLEVYDVILMDYDFPREGGARATELIMARHPRARVLCLSMYDERSYVRRMVQAGARGYVLKNIAPDTLVQAIRTVMAGKRFYSNEIAIQWMDQGVVPESSRPQPRLTSREKEVLKGILSGLRDREIAQRLYISVRTVDKHRENIRLKLGARNAVELVQAGMGIVE